MKKTVVVKDLIGDIDDDYINYDISEIENILESLNDTEAIDIAHAEYLQQQALRCADLLSVYLSRITKVSYYLDSLLNYEKNKCALDYKDPAGNKVTADQRKYASESTPEVLKLIKQLSIVKGTKVLIEKKYDILIKTHHHYKDIASGIRKSIVSTDTNNNW
jgi:vacuolar-type H+-ATPase subunit I/STV1